MNICMQPELKKILGFWSGEYWKEAEVAVGINIHLVWGTLLKHLFKGEHY